VQTAFTELEQASKTRNVRLDSLDASGATLNEISVSQTARLRAEAELAQAEWDLRIAYQQFKKAIGDR
jgi:hypothetical protein